MPVVDDSELDTFGEDDGDDNTTTYDRITAAMQQAVGDIDADTTWFIESQRAWELCGDLCTLTSFVNGDGSHMKFEVLKSKGDLLTVTCTQGQFQELCDEHNELSGPARVNAAISQLFKEGLEEFPEKALEAEREVDDFGEDDEDLSGPPPLQKAISAHITIEPDEWYVESQHSWEIGGQLCTLISSTTGDGEQLRFEVLKTNSDTITIQCTRQQFQDLCDEQPQDTEPARANAAIRQLFKEGLEEFPAKASVSVPQVNKDLSRRLKTMLRSWNRCSDDGLVKATDMKALLRRIHPRCPDSLLEALLGKAQGGKVSVDTLVDGIIKGVP